MKYQPLTKEDLNKLEKEFIDFLVINGITAGDWSKLLKEDASAAEEIIHQFSDVVWEQTLRKTTYLVKRESDKVYCFYCADNEISLKLLDKGSNRLKQATKPYSKVRELELFEMIQQGCEIDNEALYEKI